MGVDINIGPNYLCKVDEETFDYILHCSKAVMS